MATIEATEIQYMLDEIQKMEKSIKSAGEAARGKLDGVKVIEICKAVTGDDIKLDPAKWSKLTEDEQHNHRDRLSMLYEFLRDIAGLDGPADSKHIMSGAYASTTAILAWAAVGFILTVSLLIAVAWNWAKSTGTDFARAMQAASIAVRDLDSATDRETKAMAACGSR